VSEERTNERFKLWLGEGATEMTSSQLFGNHGIDDLGMIGG
jgi:hypothetical protein